MEKQSITNASSSSSSSWIRGNCIGRGCFGTVSKAVSKIDGGVFAVKSVDLATCLPAQSESLENEIEILRSLKTHPHIVKFLGDDVSRERTTTFRNLHLEYLPEGDVANGGIVVDETLLRRYVWCLVSALRHVHVNGIVHCDIKSKNVLVVNGGSSVKLADFGSAIEFAKPTVGIAPRGSPLWMAPEVIRREYQGPESDVWSLGCTVIEMLTGKPAWEDHGFDSLSRIGFSNELPYIPAGISELGRDFLDKCLRRDRSQRWSCDQLLEHPFLCQGHHSFFTESSPRCVLDWVNSEFEEEEEEEESNGSSVESMVSAMAKISKLATSGGAIWESNGWTEVRVDATEELGAKWEYPVSSTRLESELETTDESVTPPGNEEESVSASRSVMTCEMLLLVVLLLVVENIQIYATFYTSIIIIIRILYCCCYHHQINDKKKKIEKKYLSFILSLNFFVW
ncbi:LOW QUALITY PROTEIN: mitogen-activated protein kinase kinase kinase 18 [Eutrema salsugineum]|uniref:LOW QUALITY PROTEIN: mitogen-activated protein kinase kinase kinase 18 n=1 Tax=Eutrema salsugineum TaxID=72664 RepID=UPI000CED44F2|nr:LOW QUALITY PROTEIN: mitogen-activated protein kinase kinase kinase 18 [Eutrema salsugineum]